MMRLWGIVVAVALLVTLATPAFNQVAVAQGGLQIGDEDVDRRGQTSKTFYLGDNQYRFITTSFLHYQDGEGDWQDINNEFVSAQAPWDWEMTQDSFNVRVLEDFTSGQVIKWEYGGYHVAVPWL